MGLIKVTNKDGGIVEVISIKNRIVKYRYLGRVYVYSMAISQFNKIWSK